MGKLELGGEFLERGVELKLCIRATGSPTNHEYKQG